MYRNAIIVSVKDGVMRILRQGCLILDIVYVQGTLLLLIFQSGQRMTCYVGCIVIYIFHRSFCWWYTVLRVRNAMFRSVRLNRSATWCIRGLRYVNIIHFFVCVCVGVFLSFGF